MVGMKFHFGSGHSSVLENIVSVFPETEYTANNLVSLGLGFGFGEKKTKSDKHKTLHVLCYSPSATGVFFCDKLFIEPFEHYITNVVSLPYH